MWTEESFLKMMQNNELYGKEIQHIKCADDEWLVHYFERRLSKILYWGYFYTSKYCHIEYEGKGDIKCAKLVEGGFALTVKQCVDIGNFIACRWYRHHYTNEPLLCPFLSFVVLSYIEYGYPLYDNYYDIVYKLAHEFPDK